MAEHLILRSGNSVLKAETFTRAPSGIGQGVLKA